MLILCLTALFNLFIYSPLCFAWMVITATQCTILWCGLQIGKRKYKEDRRENYIQCLQVCDHLKLKKAKSLL